MNANANKALPRGLLLGAIIIFSFSLSGCQLFKSIFGFEQEMEEEVMMEEEKPMEEETMVEKMDEPEPIAAAEDVHVVIKGDSLWKISALSSVYNDPFRWPVIYAHNKDIQDADLIYPGQELAIRRDVSSNEIDAAVYHAKNRGSWAIGEIEESDTAYRSSAM